MSTSDRPSSVHPLDPIAAHLQSGPEAVRRDFLANLYTRLAKFHAVATKNDYYQALAYTVRDRLLEHWLESMPNVLRARQPHGLLLVGRVPDRATTGEEPALPRYLRRGASARCRSSASISTSWSSAKKSRASATAASAVSRLATWTHWPRWRSPRSATAFATSSASSTRIIEDGWQREIADKWLRLGNPWEVAAPRARVSRAVRRPDRAPLRRARPAAGALDPRPHREGRAVRHARSSATAYATPTSCACGRRIAYEAFDVQAFNVGDTRVRSQDKVVSENLTKVLYPNDESEAGKVLRLEQQYFFVSCTLQDMIRIFLQRAQALHELSSKYAAQLNDTHPALAVAELMRLLVDEHGLEWDGACEITTRDVRVHESHADAGGARDMAVAAVPARAAAARRNHLRDQPALSRPGARSLSRATKPASRACRSSTRAASSACAWRIWRASAATPSTASPALHTELLKAPCSPISPRCGRSGSATRPTA